MSRVRAIKFLKKQGWNTYGAEAIVDTIEECGNLDSMTPEELKDISDDYIDR